MAESKRYVPNQPLDLDRIVTEAQHRWLRPNEICEILRNHQRFQLRSDPPVRPQAGSLFLFDRKVIRYFRKDGYRWRKKKDGKTVKEAHEKLKVCCSIYYLLTAWMFSIVIMPMVRKMRTSSEEAIGCLTRA